MGELLSNSSPLSALRPVSSSPNDDSSKNHTSRSRWLCGLRRRSKIAFDGTAGSNRTQRMDVSPVAFVVLCRVDCGLFKRLIPRSGGSCGVCMCVCVCVCVCARERFRKLDNEAS